MAVALTANDNNFKSVSFSRSSLKRETQILFTDTLVNFETDYPPTYTDNVPGMSEHLFGRDTITELLGAADADKKIPGYGELKTDLEEMGKIMDTEEAAYFRIVLE